MRQKVEGRRSGQTVLGQSIFGQSIFGHRVFGQIRFWPNPFLANPFLAQVNVLVVSPSVGPPKGGGAKPRKSGAPKGGRPNILRFFPLSCLILALFVFLRVSSRGILVVFVKTGTLKCSRLGSRVVVWAAETPKVGVSRVLVKASPAFGRRRLHKNTDSFVFAPRRS